MRIGFQIDDSFYTMLEYSREKSAISNVLLTHRHAMRLQNGADFLKLKDDGRISYLRDAFKKVGHWGDGFNANGRTVGRPARIMRSLLPEALVHIFGDQDFEEFADAIKAFISRYDGTFELVGADQIHHWYHEDHYEWSVDTGTLANSCLRYDSRQPLLDFFTYNVPSRVKLLIYRTPNDTILGRALVWTTDEGLTFMDRIYGTAATQQKFKTYAEEQGWWYRGEQSYRNATYLVSPDGNREHVTLRITMDAKPPRWDEFPYLDTFKFMSLDGYLTNDDEDDDVVLRLDGPEGDPSLIRMIPHEFSNLSWNQALDRWWDTVHEEEEADFTDIVDEDITITETVVEPEHTEDEVDDTFDALLTEFERIQRAIRMPIHDTFWADPR